MKCLIFRVVAESKIQIASPKSDKHGIPIEVAFDGLFAMRESLYIFHFCF